MKIVLVILLFNAIVYGLNPENVNDLVKRIEQLNDVELYDLSMKLKRFEGLEIRADKAEEDKDDKDDSNDSNDSNDNKKHKKTKVLDMLVIRIIIGIGAFFFINVVVITIHHIYMLASSSEKNYRSIERTLSPF
ncbi:hypothetical protein CLIB1444_04S06854 [[Candida] jaroonii]|uniref:Uncharacterized protein n=1 Tax=[Candida] jaroonii TaxID=467808 RepID=A0ACA9Y776_9ASCO|nr:hypothetical protein CLIB1444_04S06854 [[Candida] jaroonii]